MGREGGEAEAEADRRAGKRTDKQEATGYRTVGYLLASDRRAEVHAYEICSTFLSELRYA